MSDTRVFIETNTIKLSTDSRTILRPYQKTVRFGPNDITLTVHDIVDVSPNDAIRDQNFRREVDLLPRIAELAKQGALELLTTGEVFVELMGVTTLGRRKVRLLDGVPVTQVRPPIEYSRIISEPLINDPSAKRPWRDAQVEFLLGIDHPRFRQLRRACGADQGKSVNANQLIDAFHIWCAEGAEATHFLTCDLKLIRLVRLFKKAPVKVRAVTPSELLADLNETSPTLSG